MAAATAGDSSELSSEMAASSACRSASSETSSAFTASMSVALCGVSTTVVCESVCRASVVELLEQAAKASKDAAQHAVVSKRFIRNTVCFSECLCSLLRHEHRFGVKDQ